MEILQNKMKVFFMYVKNAHEEIKSTGKSSYMLLLLSRFSQSNSEGPLRWQPSRLPRPWDSPGKNTGVGCHFLFQFRKVKVKVKSFSCVRLFATPWSVAYQAPPFMGFSGQEYRKGVPLPSLKSNYINKYKRQYKCNFAL